MFTRLWILIISLLLLPVSCKQEPAKKQAAEDNSVPDVRPPVDRPETEVPEEEEEDDCNKNTKKNDEDDEEEKEDEEAENEEDDRGEIELRLMGPSKNDLKVKGDVKTNVTKKNNNNDKKVKGNVDSTTVGGVDRGLSLRDSDPTYDDDISSILKDKCASCHSGSDENAMDSYKKAKALKDKIKSAISSGDMPPEDEAPLTSTEKTAIKNWVAAGAPETSDDVEKYKNESNSDCDEVEEVDDKEDEDKESGSDNSAEWDELLRKKEVENCKDKGKIFDRLTETCHKAKVAEYKCDAAGIDAQFEKVKVNKVSEQISGFIREGYSIDQCGEYNNEPIVLFYKKETEKEELKLLIKKLCKKGSGACDN